MMGSKSASTSTAAWPQVRPKRPALTTGAKQQGPEAIRVHNSQGKQKQTTWEKSKGPKRRRTKAHSGSDHSGKRDQHKADKQVDKAVLEALTSQARDVTTTASRTARQIHNIT